MRSIFVAVTMMASLTLPAFAQENQKDALNQPMHEHFQRGSHASDHNLRQVGKKIEKIIDKLQHDRHDYAGHRIAAIADLQKAHQEIEAAEKADKSH